MFWMISCGSRIMEPTIFQERLGTSRMAGESQIDGPRMEGELRDEVVFLGRSRTRIKWSQVEGFWLPDWHSAGDACLCPGTPSTNSASELLSCLQSPCSR